MMSFRYAVNTNQYDEISDDEISGDKISASRPIVRW